MKKYRLLILLPLLLLFQFGCGRKAVPLEQPASGPIGGTLICAAETEEEAKQIGELYGIELIKFGHGMALYSTEEDLQAVIRRGKEQGWPELSINHTATTA